MFMMKDSTLIIIKNHDRRNYSVFKYGIIPSIKLLYKTKILAPNHIFKELNEY